MKSSTVLLLMLLTIVIAAVRFDKREGSTDTEKNIDQLATSLSGVERSLPRDARISYLYKDVNTDVYLWSRYLLAPRYLSVNKNEHFDTALVVCKNGISGDSCVGVLTGGKRVIWSNKDGQYQYYLVSNSMK